MFNKNNACVFNKKKFAHNRNKEHHLYKSNLLETKKKPFNFIYTFRRQINWLVGIFFVVSTVVRRRRQASAKNIMRSLNFTPSFSEYLIGKLFLFLELNIAVGPKASLSASLDLFDKLYC